MGPGHLDPQRAAEAVRLLKPKVAVPVHWGTLAVAGLASAPGRLGARMRRLLTEPAGLRYQTVGVVLRLELLQGGWLLGQQRPEQRGPLVQLGGNAGAGYPQREQERLQRLGRRDAALVVIAPILPPVTP